jgi:hypothetical protein
LTKQTGFGLNEIENIESNRYRPGTLGTVSFFLDWNKLTVVTASEFSGKH